MSSFWDIMCLTGDIYNTAAGDTLLVTLASLRVHGSDFVSLHHCRVLRGATLTSPFLLSCKLFTCALMPAGVNFKLEQSAFGSEFTAK